MTESIHNQNKARIGALREALYDVDPGKLRGQLREIFAPDCLVQLANPFETLSGGDGLYEEAYAPLLEAVPDLERRDFIVMAGESNGGDWVGCGGHYMGVFEKPWLDIPPTRHLMAMRYHEFFRLEAGTVVEMQALWDIPQVMMQAGAWPMTPSLAPEWVVPGPATEDGIVTAAYDEAQSQASVDWVTGDAAGFGALARGRGSDADRPLLASENDVVWTGRHRLDAADIGLPQLASDTLS